MQRMSSGRLFHSEGAWMANAREPYVFVLGALGTASRVKLEERRFKFNSAKK